MSLFFLASSLVLTARAGERNALDLRTLAGRLPANKDVRETSSTGFAPSSRLAALFFLSLCVLRPTALHARPSIAVIGIHADQGLEAEAGSLTPMLRDAFQRQRSLSPISEAAILELIAGKGPALRDAVFLAPAREALAKARELAGLAEFRQAIAMLQEAEAHLSYYREHLTSNEDFLEVELFLLQLLFGLGEYDQATGVLRRLATVAPERELDPLRFSSQSIALYDRIKTELRYTTGLQISSEPESATAYLDGRPRGTTPLFLPQIPQGRHYIRLEGPAGVFFQDVVLDSSDSRTIHGVLGPPGFHTAPDETPAARRNATSAKHLTSIYHALGQALRVDYLLLAVLDEDGLEASLFHVQDEAFSPSYKVLLEPGRAAPASLDRLAAQLAGLVLPDGELSERAPLDQPPSPDSNRLLQKYFFESHTPAVTAYPVAGTTARDGKERSLFRQPWFWGGAGGVVGLAAGTATWFAVKNRQNNTTTVSIRFHFPAGQ